MVITLIGYRGSGKSTVAGPLAAHLGWTPVDADAVIERAAGRTIREIFESEGEPGFRLREREAMRNLLLRDKLVLAAGGGAILNADTRTEVRAAGPVVWLQASVDTLFARISGDWSTAERRPNLVGGVTGGGREEIEAVLKVREPLYRECATCIVETDHLATSEIVDRILEATHIRP